MDRLSSSPLGAFLACERRFWEEYKPGRHPVVPNEAMAFGTIFHALAEFRLQRRRWPTRGEFDKMKGNYEDPRVAAKSYPGLYEEALAAAQQVLAEQPELFEMPEGGLVEVPLEGWGLTLGGVPAKGFIDLFVPQKQKIIDWKTRKSLRFGPKSDADFRADAQLCYYAAAAALHHGWAGSVVVEHRNVQRNPVVVEVVEVELPVAYLRGVWEYLDTQLVPEMVEVYALDDQKAVPRRPESCFSKGPCPHMAYCEQTYQEDEDDPWLILNGTEPDPFAGVLE